jgi:hypothetical protein
MIAASNGEVYFSDGLAIAPHCEVGPLLKRSTSLIDGGGSRVIRELPGFSQHLLGIHRAEHGDFDCEVTSASDGRVCAVFLSHVHQLYDSDPDGEAGRHTFHLGVVQTDLKGQTEFPWGSVGFRSDRNAHQDWLVVAYSRGVHVPLRSREGLKELTASEITPKTNA